MGEGAGAETGAAAAAPELLCALPRTGPAGRALPEGLEEHVEKTVPLSINFGARKLPQLRTAGYPASAQAIGPRRSRELTSPLLLHAPATPLPNHLVALQRTV
jgi:hypothetical protein